MQNNFFASTYKLYQKMAAGEAAGFTAPAFNIRTLTFDILKALFRAAGKESAGAFIIELAQSEMDYTSQMPQEYAQNCLKAAKAEKFKGPLFLQGDHFKPIGDLDGLIKQAISAGFYNIDIDCSALPMEQNIDKTNFYVNLINGIRRDISIGGEVNEIGGRNTTVGELEQFLRGVKGIIKIAAQTGTAHGRGGDTDFALLSQLSEKAKEFGLAGVVQHGASTLPDSEFAKFPKAGACEIHLATQLMDIVLQSRHFPNELKEVINKKPAQERKKMLGPLKEKISAIPQRDKNKIAEELEARFRFFLRELNVSGSKSLIEEIYS